MPPKPIKPRSSPWGVWCSIAGVLLLLFILVSGYSLMMWKSVRQRAEKENLAAVQAQANYGLLFVADHQKNLLQRLAAIASRRSFKMAVRKKDQAAVKAYLAPLARGSDEITFAFLTDNRGDIIYRTEAGGGPATGKRILPLKAAQLKPKTTLWPVEQTAHGARVTLSAPVWGPSGALMGFLGVRQSPVLWQRFFSNLSARPGRIYYLIDQNGGMVASGPGPRKPPGITPADLLARLRLKPGGNAAFTGLMTARGRNGRVFVSAAVVTGLSWVLAVEQGYDQAMAGALALGRGIWQFLLVLFGCLLIVGFLLASRYSMQRQNLIKADEQARGLEIEVKARTSDLKALTERYRRLLEDLPDMVYEIDGQGRIIFASGAASFLLGYDPAELEGKPFRDLVLPEDRHLFDRERSRAGRISEMNILALRHRAKDGGVRWLSIHSRGVSGADGSLKGRRGVARDVTRQVLAESRIRELSGQLITAQEEERKRLALDLHDELGQLLSALKIGMQALAKDAGPDVSGEMQRLIRLSQTIMDRVRALAYNLRPAILDNFGLAAAVRDLCESMAESGLLQTECGLGDLPPSVPPDVELALFRCAQEALHNVIKHSGSSWAEVSLDCKDGILSLGVKDYGHGFDPLKALEGRQEGNHLGLLGMRERLRLIGGRLRVNSSQEGTKLAAEVPMEKWGAG